MKPTTQIWALWDCQELRSVHLTHAEARNAREEHLADCCCFAEDLDTICDAVQIRTIRIAASPAPDERTLTQGPSR